MKTILQHNFLICFCLFWFFVTVSSFGQVSKNHPLTVADYPLWHTLRQHQLSDNGNWLSYKLDYDGLPDTLFVKHTKSSKRYTFPKGYSDSFIGNNAFGCLDNSKTFHLLNLSNGVILTKSNTTAFEYVSGNILLISDLAETNGTLTLTDFNLKVLQAYRDVTSYAISHDRKSVAFTTSSDTKNAVYVINLETGTEKKLVVESTTHSFTSLTWSGTKDSFAFISNPTGALNLGDAIMYHYSEKEALQSVTRAEGSWTENFEIASTDLSGIHVSDDGERVLFILKEKLVSSEKVAVSEVQVWNGDDETLYPYTKVSRKSPQHLGIWWPADHRMIVTGNADKAIAMVGGAQKFMLAKSFSKSQPSIKYYPDSDYTFTDFETGQEHPFLNQQPGESDYFYMSPGNTFIVYFRHGHWWVYDIREGTHLNLTKNIRTQFSEEDYDEPGAPPPYGIGGVTMGDKTLLLYDKYDVWEINSDGSAAKKLTKGRTTEIVYRLSGIYSATIAIKSWMMPQIPIVNSNSMLVEGIASDFSTSGYYKLNNFKIHTMTTVSKRLKHLIKAKYYDYYTFIQEDYNSPLEIIGMEGSGKTSSIFKSNKQHYQYNWGKSELISYQNEKGKALKGILFYPFDFDVAKKYPMVVQVYQKQSQLLHAYTNPGLHNGSGFNKTNLTSNGYFVLYPDIVYEMGNPGFSALDCVISATKAAIASGFIDKENIGLTGHSFGGYETNFIITQTNMFKTAIAGAGISDFVSSYLSYGVSYKRHDAWRFENDQFRMKKSLFEDWEGYRNNSPITFAEQVKTPLLSWAGEIDAQVNKDQTMAFYFALRKLNKLQVMLLYPGEGHVLQDKKNQEDLSNKLVEWFDYYLKGNGRKPDWLNP
ncbi:S9 family peptidase [Flavobacterium sp. GSN2]|nr:S9 family peptidase [Flavobacterium sp. GSN2]